MAERCVLKAVSSSTDSDVKTEVLATELVVYNKSGADLSLTVVNDNGLKIVDTFVLKDGQGVDWKLNPFRKVSIRAVGFYQVVVGKEAR